MPLLISQYGALVNLICHIPEFDFQPPEVPPGATLAELDRVGIGALFGVGSGGLAVVPKVWAYRCTVV